MAAKMAGYGKDRSYMTHIVVVASFTNIYRPIFIDLIILNTWKLNVDMQYSSPANQPTDPTDPTDTTTRCSEFNQLSKC